MTELTLRIDGGEIVLPIDDVSITAEVEDTTTDEVENLLTGGTYRDAHDN